MVGSAGGMVHTRGDETVAHLGGDGGETVFYMQGWVESSRLEGRDGPTVCWRHWSE